MYRTVLIQIRIQVGRQLYEVELQEFLLSWSNFQLSY